MAAPAAGLRDCIRRVADFRQCVAVSLEAHAALEAVTQETQASTKASSQLTAAAQKAAASDVVALRYLTSAFGDGDVGPAVPLATVFVRDVDAFGQMLRSTTAVANGGSGGDEQLPSLLLAEGVVAAAGHPNADVAAAAVSLCQTVLDLAVDEDEDEDENDVDSVKARAAERSVFQQCLSQLLKHSVIAEMGDRLATELPAMGTIAVLPSAGDEEAAGGDADDDGPLQLAMSVVSFFEKLASNTPVSAAVVAGLLNCCASVAGAIAAARDTASLSETALQCLAAAADATVTIASNYDVFDRAARSPPAPGDVAIVTATCAAAATFATVLPRTAAAEDVLQSLLEAINLGSDLVEVATWQAPKDSLQAGALRALLAARQATADLDSKSASWLGIAGSLRLLGSDAVDVIGALAQDGLFAALGPIIDTLVLSGSSKRDREGNTGASDAAVEPRPVGRLRVAVLHVVGCMRRSMTTMPEALMRRCLAKLDSPVPGSGTAESRAAALARSSGAQLNALRLSADGGGDLTQLLEDAIDASNQGR